MNCFLNGMVRALAEAFDLPTPIYEIGAFQVEGQEQVADLRGFFPNKKYVGVDMRPGKGVDLVADVQKLPLPDASVGTVLAVNCFEHVPRFWEGIAEVKRVLRPDGAFLISCPFYFHIHAYPGDYWRFTPQAIDMLLEEFPQRIIGWHGPDKRPGNVWALGLGPKCPAITPPQLERYAALLRQFALEPGNPSRIARYYLSRLLCGHGPFAPYLDRNRWKTEFHQDGQITWRAST